MEASSSKPRTRSTPSAESQPAQTEDQSSQGKGKAEHVTEGEESYEKGYWGTRDNPFDDEEFALTTGPDAPLQDLQGNPVDVDEHIDKSASGAQPQE